MTAPYIARTIKELKKQLAATEGGIGFVPTMGALHSGHSSLVTSAKKECACVVVSIFVNPTQFGLNEDFSRYPRTEETDIERLGKDQCDIVFIPDAGTIYPEGFSTFIEVDGLSNVLDGLHRPGHFRGVATVVARLLNIVAADKAYFGEKDYQQLTIIRRMVRDLSIPTEIVGVQTVREPDGLALSSRNRYLSIEELEIAPKLFRTLCVIREDIKKGSPIGTVLKEASDWLITSGFSKLDYLELRHRDTLKEASSNSDLREFRLFIAAWLGKTRLIDNIEL